MCLKHSDRRAAPATLLEGAGQKHSGLLQPSLGESCSHGQKSCFPVLWLWTYRKWKAGSIATGVMGSHVPQLSHVLCGGEAALRVRRLRESWAAWPRRVAGSPAFLVLQMSFPSISP